MNDTYFLSGTILILCFTLQYLPDQKTWRDIVAITGVFGHPDQISKINHPNFNHPTTFSHIGRILYLLFISPPDLSFLKIWKIWKIWKKVF